MGEHDIFKMWHCGVAVTVFSCAPIASSPVEAFSSQIGEADVAIVADTNTREAVRGETAQSFLEYRYFPSAEQALLNIVSNTKPRVIGFGEYHNRTTDTAVSALHRFSTGLLPAISSITSDIVVEALVPTGDCGETAERAVTEIKEDTNRPEATEDETTALFRQARSLGIFPHYLVFTCSDHKLIYDRETVDYWTLLALIGKKLTEKTTQVINFRAASGRKSKPLILVYGGAVHNDADPSPELREVSFGPDLKTKVPPGKFVEIDLVVPELMEDISFVKSAAWYPLFQDKVDRKRTLLIKRSNTSYIIVFPLSENAERLALHRPPAGLNPASEEGREKPLISK